MGDRADQPIVLQDRAAAHPLYNAAGGCDQLRVGDPDNHISGEILFRVGNLFDLRVKKLRFSSADGREDFGLSGVHFLPGRDSRERVVRKASGDIL